jgi:hypothetical protein
MSQSDTAIPDSINGAGTPASDHDAAKSVHLSPPVAE